MYERKDSAEVELRPGDVEEFRKYLYERENAAGTIAKYTADVRTFLRYMNGEAIVRKKNLVEYKEWLQEHYALSSTNSMIVSLNQFLSFLGAGRLRLRCIRVQKQMFSEEERYLTKEEYRRLLRAAEAQEKEQLALIIETLGATGIRISELGSFTVENVKRGKVEIYNKGKHRVILLPQKLRKKLLHYTGRKGIRKGQLFCTRTGAAKNRSNIWREMKRLAEASGVDRQKIFPHNLRHLFAVSFYHMTHNLVHLADLLGHSSMEVTRIYARSSMREYRKEVNRLYEKELAKKHNINYVVKMTRKRGGYF